MSRSPKRFKQIAFIAGISPEAREAYERLQGRYGNVEGFGLETLGVKVENGYIAVDGNMRTNIDGVYAIGDVTGLQQLAHTAMHQGVVAVETIAGEHPHTLDYNKIPWVTYCHPEIGSVGMTERKAREAGYNVKTGKFPLSANGKARVEGEPVGFAKMVVDGDTDQILGIHLLGGHAAALVERLEADEEAAVIDRSVEAGRADRGADAGDSRIGHHDLGRLLLQLLHRLERNVGRGAGAAEQ